MRVSTICGAFLALAAQEALANAVPKSEPRHLSAAEELQAEGFEIFPSSFTGDFGPNQEIMTLNGTIEEVMAQIEEMRPGFIAEIDKTLPATLDTDDAGGLHPRQGEDDAWRERKVARKDCNVGKPSMKDKVLAGVHYLYKVTKDKARLEHRGCTRVSCSYNAAIYMCWDPVKGAPKVYEQPWWYVGDYAKGIALEWCPTFNDGWVRGKTWDPMGLAVHVRGDTC